jgi:hypothetical protein
MAAPAATPNTPPSRRAAATRPGIRPDKHSDDGCLATEVDEVSGLGKADERGAVELEREPHGLQDPCDDEGLLPDRDHGRGDLEVDAELGRRVMPEDDHRVPVERSVELGVGCHAVTLSQ